MDDLDRQFAGNRDTFRKGQLMQQRILSAAVYLFLEQGFSRTSVREIAKKANTSIGNLYHHFPNKHEILKIIFIQMVKRLRDQISDISKLDLAPEVAFALDLRLGYTKTLEDPQLARLFHMVRTVPDIHNYSLTNKKIRLNEFFGERFSEREIELLAISIQGIADSFFQQRNEGKLPEDAAFLADCIVRGCLLLLGYSPNEVGNIMTIVEEHITKGTVQPPTLTLQDSI
jgi:AcrR family transcriptional regulator